MEIRRQKESHTSALGEQDIHQITSFSTGPAMIKAQNTTQSPCVTPRRARTAIIGFKILVEVLPSAQMANMAFMSG
jgi:hypothetical protein